MELIVERAAALDVGKDEVVACIRVPDPAGAGRGRGRRRQEVRTYPTFTSSLEALADWLQTEGITQVVMEATGQDWKPCWYVLEEAGFELMLVNARHVKILPGRKTDVGDAAWLAELLECGLLGGSFVPRRRSASCGIWSATASGPFQAHGAECQRIQKTLEDAGIKLDSVAADVLGVSGRAMLGALVAGERDPRSWPSWPRASCARSSPSCAKPCGAASASIMGCWSGWPLTTWSTWRPRSPAWTPAWTR